MPFSEATIKAVPPCIYLIENTANDNKPYVGCASSTRHTNVNIRIRCHERMGDNCIMLNNAIRKYGWENFRWSVLEECTNENLFEREIYWINKLKSWKCRPDGTGFGYNCDAGGRGRSIGWKQPPSAIKKLKSYIGSKNYWFGKKRGKMSKETKIKLSKIKTGTKITKAALTKRSKTTTGKRKRKSKGYSFHKQSGKYVVQININKLRYCGGSYENEADAKAKAEVIYTVHAKP